MVRGFLQAVQHISSTALGISGVFLGVIALPSQGVTLGNRLQRNWDDNALIVSQPPSSHEALEFQMSRFPSLENDEPIGPTFSELQLLPDLFLPRYPSFNSQLLDQQLILYSIHLFLAGPPDVLIVGSSRAIQGVDPQTLQQSLIEQGHAKLDIYNFSINGATAQVIDLLLQDILTPDQLPRLVIWADGSRAFNSGRPDRTYTQISQSDGFKQLENGMHPIVVHPSEAIAQLPCQDYLEPKFSYRRSASATPNGPAALVSSSNSHIFMQAGFLPVRHRKSTTKPYPTAVDGSCTTSPSSPSFLSETKTTSWSSPGAYNVSPGTRETNQRPITELITYSSASIDQSLSSLQHLVSSLAFDLEMNGFLPNPTEFEPTTYYQSFPYVAGEYDANYVPFQLQGVQTEATQRLAQTMQDKQIPLAFVNLPLTLDYLDTTRLNYESQFLQHMHQISQNAGFMFIDLNQADLSQNQYFADPSHLNEQGARAVARSIANQNGIPWPR